MRFYHITIFFQFWKISDFFRKKSLNLVGKDICKKHYHLIRILLWICGVRTFHPEDISPQDISPRYISPHIHFTPRTFHPTYVSPHVRFTPRTFHPTYVSPHVRFTPRTFHPTDISPHGHFTPRTFHPTDISPHGHFTPLFEKRIQWVKRNEKKKQLLRNC